MRVTKYFIKGTDFELTDYKPSSFYVGYGNWCARANIRPLVPLAWVEERKMPREEPTDPKAIEVDKNGRPWWRPYAHRGDWLSSYRKVGGLSWEELQEQFGPTVPAVVMDLEEDD